MIIISQDMQRIVSKLFIVFGCTVKDIQQPNSFTYMRRYFHSEIVTTRENSLEMVYPPFSAIFSIWLFPLTVVIWLLPFWSLHLSSRQVARKRANEEEQRIWRSQQSALIWSPAQDCMSWPHATQKNHDQWGDT